MWPPDHRVTFTASAKNMNKFLKKLLIGISAVALFASTVYAATPPSQVGQGGTGWGNIQAGGMLYGNGTGRLATTSQGTAGQVLAWLNGAPNWAATTTFSGGLTYLNGNVTNDMANLFTYYASTFATTTPALSLPNSGMIGFAGNAAVTTSNYSLLGNTTLTLLNARSGASIGFRIANTDVANFTTTGGFGFGSTFYNLDPGQNNMTVEGKLGVGVSAPTYNLDVSGLGHFTGLVDALNFVATSSSIASSLPQLTFTNATGTSIHTSASSTMQWFNSASSTLANLLVTTKLGVATNTPGNSAIMGVNGAFNLDGLMYQTATGKSLFSNGSWEFKHTTNDTNDAFKIIMDSADAGRNALEVTNATNWAHSGDLALLKFVNGTDAGAVLKLENAGTGNYITADSVMSLTKGGLLTTTGGMLSTASSTFQNLKATRLMVATSTWFGDAINGSSPYALFVDKAIKERAVRTECRYPGNTSSMISNTQRACGDFGFFVDTTQTYRNVLTTASGMIFTRMSSPAGAAAGSGGRLSASAGLDSALPLFYEAIMRFPDANSTTSIVMMGFTATCAAGDAGAEPATGVYFVASTTANWRAASGKASAYTYVDTGFAATSTTDIRKFTIISTTTNQYMFAINNQWVANITTNIPTTANNLCAHMSNGVRTGGTLGVAQNIDVGTIDAGYIPTSIY